MGITPVPLLLTLLAPASFAQWLQQADLGQLEQACSDPQIGASDGQRQQIRDRLLVLHPAPQAFELVLANANALLRCGSPDSAAVVLQRVSPGTAEQRSRWLTLRWRAAAAGLDHRQAALALRRLVDGDLAALTAVELDPGVNALDQLAAHEAALGRQRVAADVQLLAPAPTAQQLARAAAWLASSDLQRADRLLEVAVEQAAADQAWGLAVELLQQQLRQQRAAGGDGERPRQRLESLTARLDDRYGQWKLQGGDAVDPLLRSPREAGGHAAIGDSQDAPSP